jgi:hypothetical protein
MPKMQIPEYWSAKEALAVYELVDELRELILNCYGQELHEEMMAERVTVTDEFDDDIDF